MNIDVLFFGKPRELTGIRQDMVSVCDGARLVDLIEQLTEKYGQGFRQEMSQVQGIRILINGRECTLLGGMEARLKEKDTVALLSAIFGG
jgi:molybdopterin converting factor small subunit